MRFGFFLLLLSSCSIFFSGQEGPVSAKGDHYHVHFKNQDWKNKNDTRSDYIFENTRDGRILLSNSFCQEFQDLPLEQLAGKTFRTIKNFKQRTGHYTTFHDREAYHIEGEGLVDGVLVGLKLLNTRRDNCYFDFVGISPQKVHSSDPAFDDFLKTVEFK